jgi:phage internal scaffolding protein
MSMHKQKEVTKISDAKEPGQYNVMKNGRVHKVITVTGLESKVDQGQKSLTDVKMLLEPAIKRGLLRHATQFEGEMDDLPAQDYQDAMFKVAEANSMFEQLPAKIRNQFENNTANFLEFVQNPENATQLQEMGLLKGNDGKLRDGTPSGAPTSTDMNANGIPDKISNTDPGATAGETKPNPADTQ